jgi:competence protein ComEA
MLKHSVTKVMAVVMVASAVLFGGEALAAGKRKTPAAQVSGVLNLNTASVQQLDALPGVGEKAAKRIVEYRTKTPFNRPEELVKVKGFGKKKFEHLKPYLTVAGATTLKVTKGAPAAEAQGQGRSGPPKR